MRDFFHLPSKIKAKPVERKEQSTYLCDILHVKDKTIANYLRPFNLIFNLGKLQDNGQDCDHVW